MVILVSVTSLLKLFTVTIVDVIQHLLINQQLGLHSASELQSAAGYGHTAPFTAVVTVNVSNISRGYSEMIAQNVLETEIIIIIILSL